MDIPLSLLHPALRIMALSHSPASTKGIPLPQSYPQRSPQAPLTAASSSAPSDPLMLPPHRPFRPYPAL